MANNYLRKKIKETTNNEYVEIVGKIEKVEMTTKDNKPYILLNITDSSGKIITPIWNTSSNYVKIYNIPNDSYISAIGYIKEYHSNNIVYKNMEIENIKEIDLGIFVPSIKTLQDRFRNEIEKINNQILKSIIIQSISDNKVIQNIFDSPSTMISAYSYRGGLIHQIVDVLEFINKLESTELLNSSLNNNILDIDYELLKAGSIISSLGKTYTLVIKDNKIEKTPYGEIGDDLLYSRDILVKAIDIVKHQKMQELNLMSFNNKDEEIKIKQSFLISLETIEQDLIHMVSASKGPLSHGSLSVPRSKYALFLSDINNIVFSRNLFSKLEAEKILFDEDFVSLYPGGKTYKV